MRSIFDKLFFRSDWRTEIMRQSEHTSYVFPAIPPTDWSHARARLSVFRSDVEWLITFELFGYNSESGLCENQVYAFGNKIRRKRHMTSKEAIILINDVGKPLLDSDSLSQNLNPINFWGEVDRQLYHFTPTPTDYAELGISLLSDIPTENEDVATVSLLAKTMRYIAFRFPELVFFQTRELLKHLDRPETLPLFLQTFDWYHPDWRKKESPSDSPCLQSLAVALEENDIAAYNCPQTLVNTHWSNWPEWPD